MIAPKPIIFGPDFNWLAVLKDLAAGAPMTAQDYFKLYNLAADWPTCACGQLCISVARDKNNVPLDIYLQNRGREFVFHISHKRWSLALHCFHRIEWRVQCLLDQRAAQEAYQKVNDKRMILLFDEAVDYHDWPGKELSQTLGTII